MDRLEASGAYQEEIWAEVDKFLESRKALH
jgi:hypothetical protein